MDESPDQDYLCLDEYRAILAMNIKAVSFRPRHREQHSDWLKKTERQLNIIDAMVAEDRTGALSMNPRDLMRLAMTAGVTVIEVHDLLEEFRAFSDRCRRESAPDDPRAN